MRNSIHYSKESRRDLDDIWSYIAQELQNSSAAKRMVDSILDAVDQLEVFPLMGTPLSTATGENRDYRFLVKGNYLIFYRVQGADVYIDRVLYGRRDYLRILFGQENTEDDTHL